jgi:Nif-specific ferredoxin III
MSNVTRDGTPWTPQYLIAIDHGVCIGCGRCVKVCGRGVMTLVGRNEDGEIVDLDDDDVERKVMTLSKEGACIGCGACSRVCPTGCQKHARESAAA